MSKLSSRLAALIASQAPTWRHSFLGGTLPPGSTFTRGSSGWTFDATGALVSASTNVARFYNDRTTLAPYGFFSEMQRTNGIRNNTMAGAVAGTPGTPPTNWSIGGLAGLSSQIVGFGQVSGIDYIDIRYFGTTNTTGGYLAVFENNSTIASSPGTVWSESCYLAVVAGALTNMTNIQFDMVAYGGGVDNAAPNFIGSLSGTLQRFVSTLTINTAAHTFIQPRISFNCTNAAAVDFTLRIGLPQMETGGTESSPIRTTGSAATRSQDLLSMPTSAIRGWNPSRGGVLVATTRLHVQYPASSDQAALYLLNNSVGVSDSIRLLVKTRDQDLTRFERSSSAGGTNAAVTIAPAPAAFVRNKIALGWSTSRIFAARDGGSGTGSSTAGALPTSPDLLQIGAYGSHGLGGTVESIAYYAGERADGFIQRVSQ